VVEDARQQADISVDQLKEKSQSLFGTDDIRGLSGGQLKKIANEISNRKN
jgi:phosphomannomutase